MRRMLRAWTAGAAAAAAVIGHGCRPAGDGGGTIAVSGAWALYPMAVRWAEEFRKSHPAVSIDISAGGAGKGIADALAGVVDIGMVSREISPEEASRGAWWIAVTKDAVVPVVSAANPVLDDLMRAGATRDELRGVWMTGTVAGWGALAGTDAPHPIHVYTRSDACGAAQTLAAFLGGAQEDLRGTGVYGDPGLAEAVRRDALGIGYNNVNYVYDGRTRRPVEGLRVLPLDLDGNGRIDEGEDFYADRDALAAAIRDGRYPSPPARELYFVCRGKPESEIVRAFIRWSLTEGQRFVEEAGYINLGESRIAEGMGRLGAE
ncbi:MAG: substrate-binding domain-containing protein [bacterium]|nr:substrate-binding domain-containing protein [bacterium]